LLRRKHRLFSIATVQEMVHMIYILYLLDQLLSLDDVWKNEVFDLVDAERLLKEGVESSLTNLLLRLLVDEARHCNDERNVVMHHACEHSVWIGLGWEALLVKELDGLLTSVVAVTDWHVKV
jgi:hypothetical protein